jgi:hypothetical protein
MAIRNGMSGGHRPDLFLSAGGMRLKWSRQKALRLRSRERPYNDAQLFLRGGWASPHLLLIVLRLRLVLVSRVSYSYSTLVLVSRIRLSYS